MRKNKKLKTNTNYIYPKYVSVKQDDGSIIKMTYKNIKEHEEIIIDDNIAYGVLNGYTDKDIKEYRDMAYTELKNLKKQIRENPNVILVLDTVTERYVVET